MLTQLPFPKGTAPQFAAHVCCGQMAGWIKMQLGTKVALSPGHIMLHGDPAPSKRRTAPQFSADDYCSEMVANLSYCLALVVFRCPIMFTVGTGVGIMRAMFVRLGVS